jgi:phosphonopyruvate decarboxylase
MIEAPAFLEPALERGYSFWAGVPCSFLTPFINYVIQSPKLTYVGAASEGEAVAIAAGAHMAGRKTVVICQNSGLGNTVNPLTSLNYIFKIPTMLIVTHRGAPGIKDEPQHELMGTITGELLSLMKIPWEAFPTEADAVPGALQRAEQSMAEHRLPYAFIMEKDSVAKYPLKQQPRHSFSQRAVVSGEFMRPPDQRMTRLDAISTVKECLNGDAVVATTGKIGRELFTLGHRKNQLYVVGSMGGASAIGLGIQQASGKPVVVLDGDGAVLMKMGVLGTIGHYQPDRFVHVILDNEAHESTGGQATVSSTMDFCTVAAGCGYRNLWRCDTAEGLTSAVKAAREAQGPNLVHMKVSISSDAKLGRPTLTPEQVKAEFMAWLRS